MQWRRLGGVEVQLHAPASLFLVKEPRYPVNRGLGGPQNLSGLVQTERHVFYPFECASLLLYSLRTQCTRDNVYTCFVMCFMSEAVFWTLLVSLCVRRLCSAHKVHLCVLSGSAIWHWCTVFITEMDCVYCAVWTFLYCFVYVYLFLIVASVRTTATEWQLNFNK